MYDRFMGENKSCEFAIPEPKNSRNFSDIYEVDGINHDISLCIDFRNF